MASETNPAKTASRSPFGRRKQLERDLEHITQEMYRRNKDLADTNRTLSLLRTIDGLVLDAQYDLSQLSNQIASAITEVTDYQMVALLGQHSHLEKEMELYGWSIKKGALTDSSLLPPKHLLIKAAGNWLKSDKPGKLFQLHGHSAENIAHLLHCTETEVETWRKKLPISSIYAVKLRVRQKLVGVLVVGSLHPIHAAEDIDSNLLDRLGEAIGVALDNKMLFEENQRVAAQLRKTNAKLKALDEAKDEFISMASHQLRTPLTTIKGYLSMILDGDVGAVKKNQKEMIQHAFDSSQRMVYLIADLLNVSRMQTGKFVIESQPTNLAEVIVGEIEQVKTQASNRGVELTYIKPDSFPVLNLDENKVRQVIMNFLDNALYYTPKGGKVTVALTSTKDAVSYTVTDTGVGVPKAVQHNLFTKFYRADNARKMRPDGTGLGLFMAKKVVVAQGGALIFNSVEGQGSTFGFTFPRKGMETTASPPAEKLQK